MRYATAIALMSLTNLALAGETERIVIHHVDARMVKNTPNTLVGTDVIASRRLTKTEAAKLLELLKSDLVDADPPYCGHHPPYVVQRIRGGKTVDTISVCGLCMTWQRNDGEVRVLGGKDSLAYLQTLLPLSDIFKDVKKLPDLWHQFPNQENVAFYSLDVGAKPKQDLKSTPPQSAEKTDEPECSK